MWYVRELMMAAVQSEQIKRKRNKGKERMEVQFIQRGGKGERRRASGKLFKVRWLEGFSFREEAMWLQSPKCKCVQS